MSRPIIRRTISSGRARALGEGLDVAAVAEDREGVAERLDLVHAVRDEEHADALAPCSSASSVVDGLDVAAGQRRGRLVEDEELGVRPSALAISTIWRRDSDEVADQRARVDVLAADAGEQLLGAAALGARGR